MTNIKNVTQGLGSVHTKIRRFKVSDEFYTHCLKQELDWLINGIEPPKPFDFSEVLMSKEAMEDIRNWNP